MAVRLQIFLYHCFSSSRLQGETPDNKEGNGQRSGCHWKQQRDICCGLMITDRKRAKRITIQSMVRWAMTPSTKTETGCTEALVTTYKTIRYQRHLLSVNRDSRFLRKFCTHLPDFTVSQEPATFLNLIHQVPLKKMINTYQATGYQRTFYL